MPVCLFVYASAAYLTSAGGLRGLLYSQGSVVGHREDMASVRQSAHTHPFRPFGCFRRWPQLKVMCVRGGRALERPQRHCRLTVVYVLQARNGVYTSSRPRAQATSHERDAFAVRWNPSPPPLQQAHAEVSGTRTNTNGQMAPPVATRRLHTPSSRRYDLYVPHGWALSWPCCVSSSAVDEDEVAWHAQCSLGAGDVCLRRSPEKRCMCMLTATEAR